MLRRYVKHVIAWRNACMLLHFFIQNLKPQPLGSQPPRPTASQRVPPRPVWCRLLPSPFPALRQVIHGDHQHWQPKGSTASTADQTGERTVGFGQGGLKSNRNNLETLETTVMLKLFWCQNRHTEIRCKRSGLTSAIQKRQGIECSSTTRKT